MMRGMTLGLHALAIEAMKRQQYEAPVKEQELVYRRDLRPDGRTKEVPLLVGVPRKKRLRGAKGLR